MAPVRMDDHVRKAGGRRLECELAQPDRMTGVRHVPDHDEPLLVRCGRHHVARRTPEGENRELWTSVERRDAFAGRQAPDAEVGEAPRCREVFAVRAHREEVARNTRDRGPAERAGGSVPAQKSATGEPFRSCQPGLGDHVARGGDEVAADIPRLRILRRVVAAAQSDHERRIDHADPPDAERATAGREQASVGEEADRAVAGVETERHADLAARTRGRTRGCRRHCRALPGVSRRG